MAAGEETPVDDRRTAPQSPYSLRQVAIGLAIFVVVLALIVALALLV